MENESGLIQENERLRREVERLVRERDAYATALADSNAAFMQKVKEFSIVKRNSASILWNLNEKRLCLGLVDLIIDETDAENCSLWMVDHQSNTVNLVAAAGQATEVSTYFSRGSEGARVLELGRGAAGWVAKTGETLLIDDVRDSEYFIDLKTKMSEQIKSLLCLPIKSRKGVLGVLNLSHPNIGAFSAENQLVLQLITDQAALAFTNYLLFKRGQDFNRRLEKLVKERTRDLRESQERFDLAVGSGKVGVWDWNVRTGKIYVSNNLKQMLGYGEDEIGDRIDDWMQLIHPADRSRVESEIRAYLEGRTDKHELELRRYQKNGSIQWFFVRGVAFRDEFGVAYRMTGSDTDITERKLAEEKLLYDALHDKLTSLPNRALFMDSITQSIRRGERNPNYKFCVICFDLDRFKIINDSLGHACGDRLIQDISERCNLFLREPEMTRYSGVLARLGGDEFAMLLEDVRDEKHAADIADQVQAEINKPIMLDDYEVISTVSIGIVHSELHYDHPEDLMRDVDAAVYQAKGLGKARSVVFQKTFFRQALTRLNLENDLRKGLKDPDQFMVYYQPIISMRTGNISGFEALLRWQHPEEGLISPGRFIPVAEETGLIIPLGKLVLEVACNQISAWKKRYGDHLYLSVNLSTRQFLQEDLADQVRQVLDQSGLSPGSLKLELTESVIMDNFDQAMDTLQAMRAMNIKLLLDDFGTGYSSLSYLHRFPLDTLKIDRSFVINMHHGPENLAIVTTIKMLASSLSMDVVAEGIEKEEQLEELRTLGCEYGQGYLFSKPLCVTDVEALLERNPHW